VCDTVCNALIDLLVSVVAGVIILAIAGLGWQKWLRWPDSEKSRITLPASPKLQPPNFKFGVLHASDDDEKIVNRVYWFKKGHKGEWYASIRHPKNLGFQYKCFVDYNPVFYSYQEVKELLAKEGYKGITTGAGVPNRAWFILEEKPTAKDTRGNTNNQYYPQ
jgi:hypothetical protein